tara:strand:- start:520 stop:981 length:462 start_codon:yes stop_codon:yes gene_type:complete
MIDNIGFFLPKLNGEQHRAIVDHISTYISKNPDKQIVIFCSNSDIVFPWNVPVLHINEAKYFYGSIMVFDILSALILKDFKTQKHKYFWIGNGTPWFNNPTEDYKTFENIFDDTNITFIVTDETVQDIYEICFNKPKHIFKEFNYENLQKLIG